MWPMLKVKGGEYKKKSLGGRESRIDLGIEGVVGRDTNSNRYSRQYMYNSDILSFDSIELSLVKNQYIASITFL